MPLLGRRQRIRAIVTTGLRREFKRPAAIIAIGVGTAVTSLTAIVTVLLDSLAPGGPPLGLSFFYSAASNPVILFFVTLMASVVGSGLIADDIDSMALTLYLSRPISPADYLMAKAVILVPLVSMVAVLPLVLTPFLAAILGFFPWDIGLEAMGVGFLIGLLLTMFYTSISLFLSSITRRKSYAAAGVFAVTFGLTIPAGILRDVTENSAFLFLSPWEDFQAIARVAFGAAAGPIDWPVALVILIGSTILAALVTYLRMKAIEVVSG